VKRALWIAGFTVAFVTAAAAQPHPARVDVSTSGHAAAAPSKKAQYLAAKEQVRATNVDRASTRRVGIKPVPILSLYNTWTQEWLALDSDPRAELPPGPVIDRFLRCHFTNQPTAMDRRLARVLREAGRHFRKLRIDIVSGFRSPKYNLMLRKKGHEVARDSQHTHGDAVDFRLPGISTRALEKWARRLRLGGVGLYLDSGFVHVDTGPVRTWGGT
jgi:uncharacterized protein YcbK (DUF882 family)